MWPDETRTPGSGSVAPDLYELGDSMEAWASGVLDLLEPGPLVLVGNSVGGSCAIEMARLAPHRVRLIVLVGAKPGHRPEPAFRDQAVRVIAEEGMAAAWQEYWEPLFAADTEPSVLQRARAIALSLSVDAVINGVQVFHSRPDRSAFLESLDVPVLVVSGAHDRTPGNSSALVAKLRSGSFRLVEGAGHYVPIERPTEFAAIVRLAMDGLADYP
jgi:pimeloyl-ACP methyl ester carboxylesterase